jgi:hypothetical protein
LDIKREALQCGRRCNMMLMEVEGMEKAVKFFGISIMVAALFFSISIIINCMSDRYFYVERSGSRQDLIFDKFTGRYYKYNADIYTKAGEFIEVDVVKQRVK